MDTNVLYYGDNLDILRKYIPDNSIDLIYLDPPFNSKATYNVLFKEPTGAPSQAQISAFEDTWHWGLESERALQEIAASPIASAEVKEFMSVLPKLVGKRTDMTAYLTMMCIRMIELRRVLKDTGSIYLHCDPTASHYLKLLMDTIFGAKNFRNEITWKRRHGFSSAVHESNRFGNCTDIILFYAKSDLAEFTPQYNKDSKGYKEYIEKFFNLIDENGRRYQATSLTNPAYRPNLIYEYKGYKPPQNGWMITKEKMEQWDREGRIHFPQNKNGRLRRKSYADELMGMPIQNLWDDIEQLDAHDAERLGYQTQKPEALLERISKASSNEGDIVLDPFCGCGTAIVAAQRLNRRWIGIDITHLAIGLMKWRLKNISPMPSFKVVGEPKDLADATELADQNKYQFQWWAVSFIGGQPYGSKKKGADTGIDGYLYYMDEKDKIKKAIISVKGGGTSVKDIRDLGYVIDREKSDIGIFISLHQPTHPMREEAAMKGFYHSPLGKDYPRIQILTIEEILGGKSPEIPPWIAPIIAPSPSKKIKGKTKRLL